MSLQVEHKTEKGTVLFVKVPDSINKVRFLETISELELVSGDVIFGKEYEYLKIKQGFQLIGLTNEVTEKQAKMMVKFSGGPWNAYRDYTSEKNWFASALWSFKSLMQHLKIYDFNPFQCADDIMTHKNLTLIEYGNADIKYENAQSRTGKWIVLFKPND